MPQVIVFGMPLDIEQTPLKNLWNAIQSSVAAIGELAIEKYEVTVWFPQEILEISHGEQLFVLVKGLYNKHPKSGMPDRTPSIRHKVAEVIVQAIRHTIVDHDHLPDCNTIEVCVGEFDTDKEGHATWQRDKRVVNQL